MTQVLPAGFTGTTVEFGAVPQKTLVFGLPVVNLGAVTGDPFVVNMATGPAIFYGILTGNANLAIEGLTAAKSSVLRLQQDAAGGHTLGWTGAGGLTITPANLDVLSMPTGPNAQAEFALTVNGAGVNICSDHIEPTVTLP